MRETLKRMLHMYSFCEYVRVEICKNQNIGFLSTLKKIFFNPSSNALFWLRLFYVIRHKKKFGIIATLISNKLVRKYGVFVGRDTKIDIGLYLPHPNGIIFGNGVVIGRNATIYQQVTFGGKIIGDAKANMYPLLDDNCTVFAGAKVIGGIKLSNSTIVGANAVLMCNTEPESVYGGIPARRLK